MKADRMVLRAGLALAGAAIVAVASTTLVRAFNPQPDPPGDVYSLIGLLRGQSIEVTVSNFGVAERGIPPGPCRGSLNFYDATGNVVKTETFALAAGHSAVMSLTLAGDVDDFGDDVNTVGSARTFVRAGVSFRKAGREPFGEVSPGPCVSGVNVVGADGATTLFQAPGVTQGYLNGNHNETLVIDSDR